MKRLSGLAALAAAARGVKLVKGDKVIALVTMEDKSTSSARFVIRQGRRPWMPATLVAGVFIFPGSAGLQPA